MHNAQLLAHAIKIVRGAGYEVREEMLEGAGGGHCVVRGRKWILLDLTQTHREQLDDVVDALCLEPALDLLGAPRELVDRLQLQKAA